MAGNLFSCSACLRRAIQATASREVNALRTGATNFTLLQQRNRQYATASATAITSADAPQSLNVEPLDPSVAERKNKERLERVVKKHLDHMSNDAWKVAEYVQNTLAKDRFDEALLLTQKASKDKQLVVAWNHLIDYQLGKQQLKRAIKLYNDMKKRGQLPSAQTFTIIFRGCAKSQHPKLAVAEAVKLYNVLLNNKRFQPNSIHLNAVLNVCARAGDLDSMFLITNTINESTRAPTPYTYTTILNALRHHVLKDLDGLSEEQQAINLQKTVDRAKSIWTEVIDKWRRAQLIIDEELVCAMGRVLLIAPKREDKREVLDLLQQTMSIPNLAKSSDSNAFGDSDMQNIAVSGSAKPVPAATRAVFAVPGRNTLALVLTVLASSRLTNCGVKYWNLMVRHYGIVPDNDNWLRMLGMLKVAKASTHAVSILELIPDEYINSKHYSIAMETCVRDNINPNAIANSNRVLDSMLDRLAVPDLQTLRLYLRVALVSHFHLRARAQNGDKTGAKRDYGAQITTALARLWEPYKKVHYHYFKEVPANTKDNGLGSLYNSKREVIALARLMFSSFNKVINEQMLPDEDLRELRPVGAKLNREIQSFYSNREELEPKLRKSSPRAKGSETVEDDDMNELESTETGFRPGGAFIWNTIKRKEDDTR